MDQVLADVEAARQACIDIGIADPDHPTDSELALPGANNAYQVYQSYKRDEALARNELNQADGPYGAAKRAMEAAKKACIDAGIINPDAPTNDELADSDKAAMIQAYNDRKADFAAQQADYDIAGNGLRDAFVACRAGGIVGNLDTVKTENLTSAQQELLNNYQAAKAPMRAVAGTWGVSQWTVDYARTVLNNANEEMTNAKNAQSEAEVIYNNLLGKREPGIYGDESYEALCRLRAGGAGAEQVGFGREQGQPGQRLRSERVQRIAAPAVWL